MHVYNSAFQFVLEIFSKLFWICTSPFVPLGEIRVPKNLKAGARYDRICWLVREFATEEWQAIASRYLIGVRYTCNLWFFLSVFHRLMQVKVLEPSTCLLCNAISDAVAKFDRSTLRTFLSITDDIILRVSRRYRGIVCPSHVWDHRDIIQMPSKMIRRSACQIASSIHSSPRAEVHEVPMDVIIRPFPAVVNEEKVESLMSALKNVETEHTVPPIDVLWIKGTEGEVAEVEYKCV